MPIYEFFCPHNRRIYSFLARSLAYAGKTPRCPDGDALPMERLVSPFAVTGRAQEPGAAGSDDAPDDPRMERAMMEMEREFSSLGDDDNPDPRALARMMRKMTELGGGGVPDAMNEMMARLEKGEDPDKLEEEYGDALEGFDPLGPEDGGKPGEDAAGRVRARATRVERDPKLYEMAEYC